MAKRQPIKNKPNAKAKNTIKKTGKNSHKHKRYGTSKLEAYFAHEFLDKLGLKYIYEYEAKDIKRYYDFAVTAYTEIPFIMEDKHGILSVRQEGQNFPINFCIEVDGGYYHSDPRVVDESKLNPMQKHNKFVDFLKDKWCALHCIPLVRIWEYDIRHNPKKVFEQLSPYIENGKRKKRIDDNRRRPH